jgi:hypothetical protein
MRIGMTMTFKMIIAAVLLALTASSAVVAAESVQSLNLDYPLNAHTH